MLHRCRIACILCPLLLLAGTVHAHEIRPAIVELSMEPQGHYRLDMRVNLESLIAGIEPEHSDTDESSQAGEYERLRQLPPTLLKQAFDEFTAVFLDRVRVVDDQGRRLMHVVVALEVPDVGDTELARDSIVTLRTREPVAGESITWSWDARFGAAILRVGDESADMDGDAGGYTAYLKDGAESEPIAISGATRSSWVQVFANYLEIGFTHIVPKGLDHILFVVGLFLLSPLLRPLLWQVTSFTLAHSITLALGIAGIVALPSAIVEPLIAASIVYVCVENVISDKLQAWRPLIVFAFGLLHGLGFAGVLAEVGISADTFVIALVAFNLGVELGQIAVLAACFLAVGLWWRNRRWYRSVVTIPASAVIAMIGSFWFVERALWS